MELNRKEQNGRESEEWIRNGNNRMKYNLRKRCMDYAWKKQNLVKKKENNEIE